MRRINHPVGHWRARLSTYTLRYPTIFKPRPIYGSSPLSTEIKKFWQFPHAALTHNFGKSFCMKMGKNLETEDISSVETSSPSTRLDLEQEYLLQKQLFQDFISSPASSDSLQLHKDYILSRNRINPRPFLLEMPELQMMQKIADAMNAVVPKLIKCWHYSDQNSASQQEIGNKLRGIISIPEKIEKLFLAHQDNVSRLKKFGTMRPDFVISKTSKDVFNYRVCEINARFSLNGFVMSSILNEIVRVRSCTPSTVSELQAISIPHMHSLLHDLRARFPSGVVWLMCEKEILKYDALILEQACSEKGSSSTGEILVKTIKPSEIVAKDGKLYSSTGEPILNCILELHQDELMNLSEDVIDALLYLSDSGNCLNDLRAVFLAHDKRLLSILSGYYGREFLRNFASEEEAETLIKHVVPTAPLDELLSERAMMHAWKFIGGGTDSHVLFKPSLSGKGVGIVTSFDFPTLDQFVHEVKLKTQQYLSSGVVQSFLRTQKFDVPQWSEETKSWNIESMPTVGTLLLMDGVFYGPGIFRSQKNSDIIALSRGGFCSPAALIARDFPAEVRFLISPKDATDVHSLRQRMRTVFAQHGVVFATINSTRANRFFQENQEFENIVLRLFGAIPDYPKEEEEKAVWDICLREKENGAIARSNTLGEFNPHTDSSWDSYPPQGIALAVVNCDKKGGGLSTVVNAENILKKLSKEELNCLKSAKFNVVVPPEFRGKNQSGIMKDLPFFLGENRVRFRQDIFKSDSQQENSALKAFGHYASNIGTPILLPDNYIMLLDNQKFVHSRSNILDNNRLLKRIRFHLPDLRSPQLDIALAGLSPELNLGAVPISQEVPKPPRFQNNLYWTPSGQSGILSTNENGIQVPKYFDKVVGTNSTENDYCRRLLAQLLHREGIVHSDIRCANLFSYGNLYRSGELVGELLRACYASNLALGSMAPDGAIKQLIEGTCFGVNALAGFSSKLIFLASVAAKGLLNMKNVELIIFGGEPLPKTQRDILKSVCSPNLKFLGIYGSAETGVFAFHSPKVVQKAKAICGEDLVNVYQYVDDMVHVEIVDESLLVTNFAKRPHLVRYDTGDLASWVSKKQRLFQVHGRHLNSNGMSLGTGWLLFEEMLKIVLQPLDLHELPCQLIVDSIAGQAAFKVTLAILKIPGKVYPSSLKEAFNEYIRTSVGLPGIDTDITITEEEGSFLKSHRSTKLVKIVDRRLKKSMV